jgi:hypothetical protein
MAGHFMALAARLVQAHPKAAVLHVNIFDLHREHRADAREGIDHQADQGAVAQTRLRGHVDAVEQDARLRDIEHRRLADFDDVLRAAHARRRIGRHNLAGHEPIEQHADRGEFLLGGRRAVGAGHRLDVSADVKRLHVDDRGEAVLLAPYEEFRNRAAIGAARVRVADVGNEEFPKAGLRAFAGGGD